MDKSIVSRSVPLVKQMAAHGPALVGQWPQFPLLAKGLEAWYTSKQRRVRLICGILSNGAVSNQRGNAMSGIVCAIRGGPGSQQTVARAIALARKTGLPLYFLYVVNLDFLAYTSSSRVHPLLEEMHQMGEFILHMAQETAANAGVVAHGVVRDGQVRDEIIGLCREVGADYVVLGRPQMAREGNLFTDEQISGFLAQIEKETGATAVLANGDGG